MWEAAGLLKLVELPSQIRDFLVFPATSCLIHSLECSASITTQLCIVLNRTKHWNGGDEKTFIWPQEPLSVLWKLMLPFDFRGSDYYLMLSHHLDCAMFQCWVYSFRFKEDLQNTRARIALTGSEIAAHEGPVVSASACVSLLTSSRGPWSIKRSKLWSKFCCPRCQN